MKEKTKEKNLSLWRIIGNNFFMLRLIWQSRPSLLILSSVLTVSSALISFLSNTYMLRYSINGLQEGKTFWQITGFVLGILGLRLLFAAVVRWYYQIYYPVRSDDVRRDVSEKVYRKAAKVELRRYENPDYYDAFVKAIDECSNRTQQVENSLMNLLWDVTSYGANFTFLALIDPLLLLFLILPLLSAPLKSANKKIHYRRSMEMKEENRRKYYSRRAFYLADYAKEMRLTRMPELMMLRFRESGVKMQEIIKRYGIATGIIWYLLRILQEVFTVLGSTLYCVWRTLGAGTMGYGDCVSAVNAVESLSYTLSASANMLAEFREHALYVENLRNFLDREPVQTGGNAPLPVSGDLVLEKVSFRYDGAEEYALKDVSLRFGAKEKIAIVGHNGAGKSTLVKLLLRLYDGEGTVTYGEKNIREYDPEEYRDMFSCVLQDFHIFAFSAADNVLLRDRREGDDRLVADCLEKGGLLKKTETFAQGTDTVMTREFDPKGVVLSGGEQQKLAISHVYSKENRFVILDEPSSALDPIAEHDMYRRMADACEGCGMIFISHRLSSAVDADRIYLMEQGSVSEVGTHKELMEKNGRYAEMFRRQAANYGEVAE